MNLNGIKGPQLKIHLDQAKASYTEAKAATEYQDQKVARLLTILAFLTAAAATIFAKFIDIYAINTSDRPTLANILIYSIYGGFGIYFLVIAAGALTTFYATQTRFAIPEDKDFKSLLFFRGITSHTPEEWGKEFSLSEKDICTKYIEHYVIETYLIAVKTDIKVQYLNPAQKILQLAIRILIIVIFLLVVAFLFVSRDSKQHESKVAAEPVTYIQNVSPPSSAIPSKGASEPNLPEPNANPAVSAPDTSAQAPATLPTKTAADKLPGRERTRIDHEKTTHPDRR